MDKNYEDLYKVLGHALPEINDKTFYHKFISQKEMEELGKKPTMIHMRFSILWQIWIEHLMHHYPLFKETQSDHMRKNGNWQMIADHFYKTKPLDSVQISDLGIYNPKELETVLATKDFNTFRHFKKLEDRINWYFKRMFEQAAMNKKQLFDLVDVKGAYNQKKH